MFNSTTINTSPKPSRKRARPDASTVAAKHILPFDLEEARDKFEQNELLKTNQTLVVAHGFSYASEKITPRYTANAAKPSAQTAKGSFANRLYEGIVQNIRTRFWQWRHAPQIRTLAINPALPVFDQEKAGICWMAGPALQLLHHANRFGISIDSSNLSFSYWMFYDKLEKANSWLNKAIKLIHHPYTHHKLTQLLFSPGGDQDGGFDNDFVSILVKYGAVPKSQMPDSKAISNPEHLNHALTIYSHDILAKLKDMVALADCHSQALLNYKKESLQRLYNILAIHLGTPPLPHKTFTAKIKKSAAYFGQEVVETPISYVKNILHFNPDEFITLVNLDIDGFPLNTMLVDAHRKEISNGAPHRALNVSWETLSQSLFNSLSNQDPVSFSCALRNVNHKVGKATLSTFSHEDLYDDKLQPDRATNILNRNSQPDHVMLISGLSYESTTADTTPSTSQFKTVELHNSWGNTLEHKSHIEASIDWFKGYAYGLFIKKSHVPVEVLSEGKKRRKRMKKEGLSI